MQLTIPIFSGGAVDAAGRQAEAARLAAQADVESEVQRLKLQFAADWAAQAGLARRAMAAFGLGEAARDQLRAAEANLRRGFKTLADLATAEQQLPRREADLASMLV